MLFCGSGVIIKVLFEGFGKRRNVFCNELIVDDVKVCVSCRGEQGVIVQIGNFNEYFGVIDFVFCICNINFDVVGFVWCDVCFSRQ